MVIRLGGAWNGPQGPVAQPRRLSTLRIDHHPHPLDVLRAAGVAASWHRLLLEKPIQLLQSRQVALVDRGKLLLEDSRIIGVREQIAVIEHGNPGGGGFWADG